MKNSKFDTLDVKKVCQSKAKVKFRKGGKEQNGLVSLGKVRAARITIPKGRKPIPVKTYKAMAHQLKLNVPEFDDFLECPLTTKEYFKLLGERVTLPA